MNSHSDNASPKALGSPKIGSRSADPDGASPGKPLHDEVLCVTDVHVSTFTLTWLIKNFNMYAAKFNNYLQSKTIKKAGPNGEIEFDLWFYPIGESVHHAETHFTLYITPCDFALVRAEFKFSILNVNPRKTVTSTDGSGVIGGGVPYVEAALWIDYEDLVKEGSGYVPNGTLTIVCECTISMDDITTTQHSSQLQEALPPASQPRDFGSLLESGEFGDVTLAVGGKEVLVHKAILAAGSPVFAAMFKHQLEESKQNRVVITDVDYDVLEKMLTYMYTGRSQDIKDIAGDLLAAADKYDVGELRRVCEEVLCTNLTVENAEDLLVFADKYRARKLKARCIYFIGTHEDEIFKPA